MLGGMHLTDLIPILIVALLIFGPKKLPEMGSSIGKSIKEFQKSMRDITTPSTPVTQPRLPAPQPIVESAAPTADSAPEPVAASSSEASEASQAGTR